MAEKSATNGTVCCIIIGTRSAETVSATPVVYPGMPEMRFASSVKSMSETSA